MGYVLPRETGVMNIHRPKKEKGQNVHESWRQRINAMFVLKQKNQKGECKWGSPSIPLPGKERDPLLQNLSSLKITC